MNKCHFLFFIFILLNTIFFQQCEEIPIEYEYMIHDEYKVTYEVLGNARDMRIRFINANQSDSVVYHIEAPWSYSFYGSRTTILSFEAKAYVHGVTIYNTIYINDEVFKSDSSVHSDTDSSDFVPYPYTYTSGTIQEKDHIIVIKESY